MDKNISEHLRKLPKDYQRHVLDKMKGDLQVELAIKNANNAQEVVTLATKIQKITELQKATVKAIGKINELLTSKVAKEDLDSATSKLQLNISKEAQRLNDELAKTKYSKANSESLASAQKRINQLEKSLKTASSSYIEISKAIKNIRNTEDNEPVPTEDIKTIIKAELSKLSITLNLSGITASINSLQQQLDSIDSSVTLQNAYDNGDGTIVTTTSKPVAISGVRGVSIALPSGGTTALRLADAPANNAYYTKVGLDSNLAVTAVGAQNYTANVSYVYLNSASSSTGFIAGADLGAVSNITAGQTATGLYGMNMGMYNYGNGTLGAAYGGYFAVYNYQGASGVTTNAYAGYFFIESFGGSTVNQYGIYVGPVTGATNNYAIFTARGLHEFNDQVYIDGRQDIVQLQVDAHATQTQLLSVWRSSAGVNQITFGGTGAAVFNEQGNAVDFRVESDTNSNMFVVRGSTNQVGIGKSPSLGIALEIDNTGGSGVLYLEGQDNTYAYMRAGGVGFEVAYRLQKSTGDTIFDFGSSSSTNLAYVRSVTGALYFSSNNTEAMRIDTSQNIGIATTTPLSKLDVVGSQGASITTVSSDTTLNATHYTVLVNASGANRTITLPAVASNTRRIYIIKKIDSSVNTVTIDANASETIDGALTQVLSSQYDYLKIQTDGSAWSIIG